MENCRISLNEFTSTTFCSFTIICQLLYRCLKACYLKKRKEDKNYKIKNM